MSAIMDEVLRGLLRGESLGHLEHALVDELDVYTVADFQEITAADADGLGLKKMERRRLERLLETMRHGDQRGGAAEKEEEEEEKEEVLTEERAPVPPPPWTVGCRS